MPSHPSTPHQPRHTGQRHAPPPEPRPPAGPDGWEEAGQAPGERLRAFAEQTVGPVADVKPTGTESKTSRVWRLTPRNGSRCYLKQHQNGRFHGREVTAYQQWTPALADRAPRLVASDTALRAVLITEVQGSNLFDAVLDPDRAVEVHAQLGQLTRQFHEAAAPRPAAPLRADTLEPRLAAVRGQLTHGDEDLLRSLADRLPDLSPRKHVPTHGDLQLRNAVLDTDGRVSLYDFERAEYGPLVRDFARIHDAWNGRPDLADAFARGYGRALTPDEQQLLECLAGLDALSGIQWGVANGDAEVVARGHRTLQRLRNGLLLPQHPVDGGSK